MRGTYKKQKGYFMSDDLTVLANGQRKIELGGKQYKIGEITVGDMAEFEARAKKKIKDEQKNRLSQAKEFFGEGKVPIEIYKDITRTVGREQVDAETGTLDGAAFLLYRALFRCNPEMTEDMAKQLIKIKDIPRVMESIGLANEGDEKNVVEPVASP